MNRKDVYLSKEFTYLRTIITNMGVEKCDTSKNIMRMSMSTSMDVEEKAVHAKHLLGVWSYTLYVTE